MTNFGITIFDAEGTAIISGFSTYIADAVKIIENFSNGHIYDFHTGEILRIYKNKKIEYFV